MYKFFFLLIVLSSNISVVFSKEQEYFFQTSIPKSGTWLLAKAIKLLGGLKPEVFDITNIENDTMPVLENNKFLLNHIPYSEQASDYFKKRNFKGFLIFRDPRDRVISFYFHTKKYKELFPKEAELDFETFCRWHFENGTDVYYASFLEWIKEPFICAVRFEDLVGEKGGGSIESQRKVLTKMAAHLNVTNCPEKINYCINHLFGNSETFRKGTIGEWKKLFTEELKYYAKNSKFGSLLITLGYEKDNNW